MSIAVRYSAKLQTWLLAVRICNLKKKQRQNVYTYASHVSMHSKETFFKAVFVYKISFGLQNFSALNNDVIFHFISRLFFLCFYSISFTSWIVNTVLLLQQNVIRILNAEWIKLNMILILFQSKMQFARQEVKRLVLFPYFLLDEIIKLSVSLGLSSFPLINKGPYNRTAVHSRTNVYITSSK